MKLIKRPVVIANGKILSAKEGAAYDLSAAKKGTMAYAVLSAHNVSGNDENLQIKFDALTSHDITYVGIVQTAKASGLEKFPVPYSLTNCHNSLCAVGGTINAIIKPVTKEVLSKDLIISLNFSFTHKR